jgi:hypothetical protein
VSLAAWSLAVLAVLQERTLGTASVGMPVVVRDLVLPAPELEVAPSTDATALVVRLDAARPHGQGFRYDLECHGLEPGEYDLAAFLRPKDGAAPVPLPRLLVSVTSVLAPGQVEPHPRAPRALPRFGGYGTLLWCVGCAWGVGLVLLLFRRRAARAGAPSPDPGARTPAARFAELVAAARRGSLAAPERAELELALIAYWRARLGLEGLEANEVLRRIQGHPEAGEVLRAFEAWLHRPEGEAIDLARLLAPYAELSPRGGS